MVTGPATCYLLHCRFFFYFSIYFSFSLSPFSSFLPPKQKKILFFFFDFGNLVFVRVFMFGSLLESNNNNKPLFFSLVETLLILFRLSGLGCYTTTTNQKSCHCAKGRNESLECDLCGDARVHLAHHFHI